MRQLPSYHGIRRACSVTVLACPGCDCARVERVSTKAYNSDGDKYRCLGCGDTFDDGVERASKRKDREAKHGLARKLELELGPEDV